MRAMPFILFSIIFAALVYAHFVFAFRSWKISRNEQDRNIDLSYVRLEDYFARSFRLKLSEWLKLPVQSCHPDGTRVILKGNENIKVTDSSEYPKGSISDDILAVQGSFKCSEACIFQREIYVQGDALIGFGTQLQAIAADGSLTLEPQVRIARWADCQGDMEIGEKCIINSRTTAGKTLVLQNGTQVKSAFAALVRTFNNDPGQSDNFDEAAPPELKFPACITNPEDENQAGLGLDPKRLKMLSPDCYIYDGDFKPSKPLHVETKLIVRGDCDIPSGSVLEKDIKSKHALLVGAGCICRGSLISDKAIWMGPGCQFFGIVHAGQTLRICTGVRGGTEDSNVAAFAQETLTVEENVAVYGKLASDDCVIVVPAN
jgi:hypothetical protein